MATVAPTTRLTTTTLVSASAGPYLVGFRLFEADGLTVTVNGIVREDWELTADLDAGYDDAASITFDATLAIDDVLTIEGTMTPEREEDYLPTERNLTDKLNAELARVWATLIEQAFRSNGALRATTPQAAIDLDDGTVPMFSDGAWAQGPLATSITDAETLLASLTGITTEVTTLAPGADATASFDEETGVLSLGIPEGEQGATGPQGASGAGSGDLISTQNLSDLANAATARTNLGLGTAALMDDSADADLTNDPDAALRRDIAKAYVDAAVAEITSNVVALGALSLPNSAAAHGLGSAPTEVSWYLQCGTTDGGWAVGDRIYHVSWQTTADSNEALTFWADATDVGFGRQGTIRTFDPGGTFRILTAANWTVHAVVRA